MVHLYFFILKINYYYLNKCNQSFKINQQKQYNVTLNQNYLINKNYRLVSQYQMNSPHQQVHQLSQQSCLIQIVRNKSPHRHNNFIKDNKTPHQKKQRQVKFEGYRIINEIKHLSSKGHNNIKFKDFICVKQQSEQRTGRQSKKVNKKTISNNLLQKYLFCRINSTNQLNKDQKSIANQIRKYIQNDLFQQNCIFPQSFQYNALRIYNQKDNQNDNQIIKQQDQQNIVGAQQQYNKEAYIGIAQSQIALFSQIIQLQHIVPLSNLINQQKIGSQLYCLTIMYQFYIQILKPFIFIIRKIVVEHLQKQKIINSRIQSKQSKNLPSQIIAQQQQEKKAREYAQYIEIIKQIRRINQFMLNYVLLQQNIFLSSNSNYFALLFLPLRFNLDCSQRVDFQLSHKDISQLPKQLQFNYHKCFQIELQLIEKQILSHTSSLFSNIFFNQQIRNNKFLFKNQQQHEGMNSKKFRYHTTFIKNFMQSTIEKQLSFIEALQVLQSKSRRKHFINQRLKMYQKLQKQKLLSQSKYFNNVHRNYDQNDQMNFKRKHTFNQVFQTNIQNTNQYKNFKRHREINFSDREIIQKKDYKVNNNNDRNFLQQDNRFQTIQQLKGSTFNAVMHAAYKKCGMQNDKRHHRKSVHRKLTDKRNTIDYAISDKAYYIPPGFKSRSRQKRSKLFNHRHSLNSSQQSKSINSHFRQSSYVKKNNYIAQHQYKYLDKSPTLRQYSPPRQYSVSKYSNINQNSESPIKNTMLDSVKVDENFSFMKKGSTKKINKKNVSRTIQIGQFRHQSNQLQRITSTIQLKQASKQFLSNNHLNPNKNQYFSNKKGPQITKMVDSKLYLNLKQSPIKQNYSNSISQHQYNLAAFQNNRKMSNHKNRRYFHIDDILPVNKKGGIQELIMNQKRINQRSNRNSKSKEKQLLSRSQQKALTLFNKQVKNNCITDNQQEKNNIKGQRFQNQNKKMININQMSAWNQKARPNNSLSTKTKQNKVQSYVKEPNHNIMNNRKQNRYEENNLVSLRKGSYEYNNRSLSFIFDGSFSPPKLKTSLNGLQKDQIKERYLNCEVKNQNSHRHEQSTDNKKGDTNVKINDREFRQRFYSTVVSKKGQKKYHTIDVSQNIKDKKQGQMLEASVNKQDDQIRKKLLFNAKDDQNQQNQQFIEKRQKQLKQLQSICYEATKNIQIHNQYAIKQAENSQKSLNQQLNRNNNKGKKYPNNIQDVFIQKQQKLLQNHGSNDRQPNKQIKYGQKQKIQILNSNKNKLNNNNQAQMNIQQLMDKISPIKKQRTNQVLNDRNSNSQKDQVKLNFKKPQTQQNILKTLLQKNNSNQNQQIQNRQNQKYKNAFKKYQQEKQMPKPSFKPKQSNSQNQQILLKSGNMFNNNQKAQSDDLIDLISKLQQPKLLETKNIEKDPKQRKPSIDLKKKQSAQNKQKKAVKFQQPIKQAKKIKQTKDVKFQEKVNSQLKSNRQQKAKGQQRSNQTFNIKNNGSSRQTSQQSIPESSNGNKNNRSNKDLQQEEDLQLQQIKLNTVSAATIPKNIDKNKEINTNKNDGSQKNISNSKPPIPNSNSNLSSGNKNPQQNNEQKNNTQSTKKPQQKIQSQNDQNQDDNKNNKQHNRQHTGQSSVASSSFGPNKNAKKIVEQYVFMVNKIAQAVAKTPKISKKLQPLVQWYVGVYFLYKRFLYQRKRIQKWLKEGTPKLTRYTDQQINLDEWNVYLKSQQRQILIKKVSEQNINIAQSIQKMYKKLMGRNVSQNIKMYATISQRSHQESRIAVDAVLDEFDMLVQKGAINDQEIITHCTQMFNACLILAELDRLFEQPLPIGHLTKQKRSLQELQNLAQDLYDFYHEE